MKITIFFYVKKYYEARSTGKETPKKEVKEGRALLGIKNIDFFFTSTKKKYSITTKFCSPVEDLVYNVTVSFEEICSQKYFCILFYCGDRSFPRRSFPHQFPPCQVFIQPVFSLIGLFPAGSSPRRSFPHQIFSPPVFPPPFLNRDIN